MCQALNLALKIKRLKDKVSSGLSEMVSKIRTIFNQVTFFKALFWVKHPAGYWEREKEIRKSLSLPSGARSAVV